MNPSAGQRIFGDTRARTAVLAPLPDASLATGSGADVPRAVKTSGKRFPRDRKPDDGKNVAPSRGRPLLILPILVALSVSLTGCQSGLRTVPTHDVPTPMPMEKHDTPPHGSPALESRAPVTGGAGRARSSRTTLALETSVLPELAAILPKLADKRVIFVGETHTRYVDHLNQLAIIRGLVEQGHQVAIGMEWFQQPFQGVLDDFIARGRHEQAMLEGSEYFERWGYDYSLYRPILRYALAQGIPLIALNLPQEIIRKVSKGGRERLSPEELARIPRRTRRDDRDYVRRLRAVFRQHPHRPGKDFERFLEVQLLWDEGMAERAARYLKAHPGRVLVVLAGSGHLAYGHGIPDRVASRIDVPGAIVLPGEGFVADDPKGAADFLLFSADRPSPATGKLRVRLNKAGDGVIVAGFPPGSPAKAAGMRKGDRIRSVDGEAVSTLAEVRLALWDKRPGDRVPVEVWRTRWLTGSRTLRVDVVLGE